MEHHLPSPADGTRARDEIRGPVSTPFNLMRSRVQTGYNLVEMMFVLALMGVLSGMAVLQIGATRPGLKGDGAMRVVLGQMNQARELAITQRRYMRVVFTVPNLVQVVREDTTTTTTTISSVLLEGGVQFALVSGVPDTPDGFGNSWAIAIGTAKFSPDGTMIDEDGVSANGSVFLALPGEALSARAVTILGSTGRVRGYKWDGAKWNVV
jgi:prepilin-type N-terminal cleavage/methylation domain-containing protein